MKISIIVPIYNAENYAERCINSVLNQTYTDFELILVDDGSADNSLALCKALAEKDNRITVLHKENGGVSSARNLGLSEATGDYIIFVDSDDYLAPDYCEFLIQTARRTNADIVCTDFFEVTETNCERELPDTIIASDDEWIGHDQISYKYCKGEIYLYQVWGKIYKRQTLDGLRFDRTLKFAEDVKFVVNALQKAEKVSLRTYKGYYYYRNGSSVTLSDKTGRIRLDTLSVLSTILKDCREESSRHTDVIGKRLFYYLVMTFDFFSTCDLKNKVICETLHSCKKYIPIAKPFSRLVERGWRIKFLIYSLNPRLAVKLKNLQNKFLRS